MISKFPPIEGGMASSAYWLARGLQEKNENVTILTNSNVVESEYRIANCDIINKNMDIKLIELHDNFIIPQRPYDIAGFLESFCKIKANKRIDVIDAQYLVPYGIVAYLINKMFGIPYILRHGGSDVERFLKCGVFSELLNKVIDCAYVVDSVDEYVQGKSRNFVSMPTYIPHPEFNTSNRTKSERIRIAYIGKIPECYQFKDLDKIVKIFQPFYKEIELSFLSQGRGVESFKSSVDTSHIKMVDFIPPWKMPSFYKNIDYILYFLNNNPLPDWSNVILESLVSGVKVITDDVSFFKKFSLSDEILNSNFIQVNLSDSPKNVYNNIMEGLSKTYIPYRQDYNEYINRCIQLYKKTAAGCELQHINT